jgi:hypothetical protein
MRARVSAGGSWPPPVLIRRGARAAVRSDERLPLRGLAPSLGRGKGEVPRWASSPAQAQVAAWDAGGAHAGRLRQAARVGRLAVGPLAWWAKPREDGPRAGFAGWAA